MRRPEREEVQEAEKKLHNEGPNDLCYTPNIIRVIKENGHG
jgi:hypothetical protein